MHNKIKSNVFITGGSGFVGANLIRTLLKNNYRVHVLNHTTKVGWRLQDIKKDLIIHKGDITNYKSLKSILSSVKPDYILHLAAYGAYSQQTELDKIVKVNIEGTKNLLEASKEINYKCFINTGSSSEYGFKNVPMKEDDYCDPVSYYAATKLGQTNICKVFSKLNKKPITTLRLFSVYGPFEEPTRFIPVIMKALYKKDTIKLTAGKQRRDFIYVEDVVNAYLQIMKSPNKYAAEIFNVGTGIENTNDEVVHHLFTTIGRKTKIQKGAYPTRNWDTTHWLADKTKITKKTNWKPAYSLDKGLKSTYSWFENNMHFYQ
jgi:nucleoside-diphosphate-sugar epimerase